MGTVAYIAKGESKNELYHSLKAASMKRVNPQTPIVFSKVYMWSGQLTDLNYDAISQGVVWTPSKMIARLGKEIDNPDSVYYWAYKVGTLVQGQPLPVSTCVSFRTAWVYTGA